MKKSYVFLIFLVIILLFNFHSISSDFSKTEPENEDLHDKMKDSENHRINKDLKEPSSKTDDEVVEREEQAIKLDGLNVAQLKEMREKTEKFRFQAEVDRMMKLIINSLYTNKEIFLRELISNASDALDKIRFMSLTNSSILGEFQDFSIKIKADKVNNLLKITDNGIGMTRHELIKHLGTIANSGTTEFLSNMENSKSENMGDFIGQFGVGFYSVYLVADSVTVISKSNDDDQYIWESDSSNQFTVTNDPRGNTLGRGTEVVLRLKSSAKEYLESENLKRLIRQYSQYLSFPIYLWSSKTVKDSEVEDTNKNDENVASSNDAVTSNKENVPSNAKLKIKWDWERINQKKPIWTRKTSQITEQEYSEFYKTLAKTNEEPLAKIHFSAEGEVTFNALLYIPQKAPQNLFERDVKESTIRLYVRRVFITDKIQEMIPRYLSFIIGIVDSDDLPLNVSRETLQQEKLMKVIQKKLVRKALDMIKKLKKNKFNIFWKEFRSAIKMGMIDDDTNRNRLTKLMHAQSSKSGENITSFSEYVSRMKSQQEEIFYIATESYEHAKSSPFVQKYIKHGYEVMYFIDSLDEHALHLMEKFESTKLLNLARGGISFDKTEGAKSRLDLKKDDLRALVDFLKNVEVIKSYIENVVLTDRLLSDPLSVVPQEQGWTGNMERLARSQSGKKEDDVMVMQHLKFKKNLEVNYKHPVIIKFNHMAKEVSNPKSDNFLEKLAIILFETSMVKCGYLMNNTVSYANIIESLVKDNLISENMQLWDKFDDITNEENVNSDSDEDSRRLDETMSDAVPQDVNEYASEDGISHPSEDIREDKEFEKVHIDGNPTNVEFAQHNEL